MPEDFRIDDRKPWDHAGSEMERDEWREEALDRDPGPDIYDDEYPDEEYAEGFAGHGYTYRGGRHREDFGADM